MAIHVTCEHCDHGFQTRNQYAGRRMKCPSCDEFIAVRAKISVSSKPPKSSPLKRRSNDQQHTSNNQKLVLAGLAFGIVVIVMGVMRSGSFPTLLVADAGNIVQRVDNLPSQVASSAEAAHQPPPASLPTSNAGNVSSSTTATSVTAQPPASPSASVSQPTSSGSATASIVAEAAKADSSVPSATPSASTRTPDAASEKATARPAEMSLADLIEKCEPSVVRVDVETAEGKGNGSGFVVDKTGVIITNYHVIAGAKNAVCAFRDGSQAKVEGFLKVDPLRDVAIIKVNHPAEKLHPIKLRTDLPRKGEKVVAFGAPLGLSWTATEGIISAFRSKAELNQLGVDGIEGDWIQTSTPISPGNSGGPLVTYGGEVIGMNTMQFTIGQNLNFAVQTKEFDLVLKQSAGAQLVALAPAVLPETSKARAPKVIDATKDDRGRKALGRLKEVTLLTVMSRDPTGHIQAVVRKRAVDTVRQLGLFVRDGDESDNELMLVTMHFEENPNSRVGAVEVHVSAVVYMRERDADGKLQLLKVWEREEKLGSLADRLFVSGELSKPVLEKLSSFFGKFKGTFYAARRAAEKETASVKKPDHKT